MSLLVSARNLLMQFRYKLWKDSRLLPNEPINTYSGNCYITLIHAHAWFQSTDLSFESNFRFYTAHSRTHFIYNISCLYFALTYWSNRQTFQNFIVEISFFFLLLKFNLPSVLCLNFFSFHRRTKFFALMFKPQQSFRIRSNQIFYFNALKFGANVQSNHNIEYSFTFFFRRISLVLNKSASKWERMTLMEFFLVSRILTMFCQQATHLMCTIFAIRLYNLIKSMLNL